MTGRWWLACAAIAAAALTVPAARAATQQARAPQAPAPLPDGCVLVAATNDLHGAIEPLVNHTDDPTRQVRVGGVIGLSGYVNRLRAQYGDRMLLLDGGDLFQGTLAANISQGRSVIEAYNLLGYDAAAIGNHEFDFGGGDDHLAVIKARIAEAHFPLLAANMVERATGRRPTWKNLAASVLLERGGVRIGVIGVASPNTARLTRPTHVEALHFEFPVPAVIEESQLLRARGAELIVMVGHIGAACRAVADPNDTSSCDESDDLLFRVLRALPLGTVDVAVGGHTHAEVAHWVHGVASIESGSSGTKIGRVVACIKRGGHGLDRAKSSIHPPLDVCVDAWVEGGCGRRQNTSAAPRAASLWGAGVQPTALMLTAMAPYLDAVRQEQNRALGLILPRPLLRDDSADSLGVKVAESLRQAAGAQVGLQNLGGVRSDLPAGPLTFGEVYRALPFDNQVAVVRLDGKRLREIIARMAGRRHGRPPYLAGLVASQRDGGWVLTLADGTLVDDARAVVVATNDYLAQGGEGLGELLKANAAGGDDGAHATAMDMRDALIAQLRREFGGGAKATKP